MYWGINYKCSVSRSAVSRYNCARAPSLSVAVSEVKMSSQTTLGRFGFKNSISHRNTLLKMKLPDFVKLKRYIVLTDFQHTKLYPFQNLSLGFILKIFLKFPKFQPRYSYKIYSYKKECTSSSLFFFPYGPTSVEGKSEHTLSSLSRPNLFSPQALAALIPREHSHI